MTFKAYIGCCCCCKKKSKPFVQSCAVFFLVMAIIKILNFFFLALSYGVTDTVIALLGVMIAFEATVLIFAILLLSKLKKPNYSLVKVAGIMTTIIFAIELVLFIVVIALYGGHISSTSQEAGEQHGEGAQVIVAVVATMILIPIMIELGIFWGFSIWQTHAAAFLIKCAAYNLKKLENGDQKSSTSSHSSDSDKEKKRKKKKMKNAQYHGAHNQQYQGARNPQYQGAHNAHSQNIQYANYPAQGQNPYPQAYKPPPGGYQHPPQGQNPPPPGYNPMPSNQNYSQPSEQNPAPPQGPLYGTHAQNAGQQNPAGQPPQPPKEDPNAI